MAGDVAAKGRKRKRRCQPELSDEPPTDAAACPRKQKKHETSNRSGAKTERGAKMERIDAGTGFKDERLSTKGPTYRETCRACQEGDLYSSTETLKCLLAGCVPCAYKMVVQPSLPHEETESARFRANKRPEECLRMRLHAAGTHGARSGARPGEERSELGLYSSGSNIMTVGDGDLTFSLSLAHQLAKGRGGAGPGGGVLVATTHLTRLQLDEAYGAATIAKTITSLEGLGGLVLHAVDATQLSATLRAAIKEVAGAGDQKQHKRVKRMVKRAEFEVVIWNFPCVSGGALGMDSQVAEMEENKELMRGFFRSVTSVLCHGGQVHVTHKTKAPFCYWDLRRLASSSRCAETDGGQSETDGLVYTRRLVFDGALFPTYSNRKVSTGRGKFPTWDAAVFVWTKGSPAPSLRTCTFSLADNPSDGVCFGTLVAQAARASEKERLKREEAGRGGSGGQCPLDRPGAHQLDGVSCVQLDVFPYPCAREAPTGPTGVGLVRVDESLLDGVSRLLRLEPNSITRQQPRPA